MNIDIEEPMTLPWGELHRHIRFAATFAAPLSMRHPLLQNVAICPTIEPSGVWFGASDSYSAGWTWLGIDGEPGMPTLPDWTQAIICDASTLMRMLAVVKPAKPTGDVEFTIDADRVQITNRGAGLSASVTPNRPGSGYPDLNKVIRGASPAASEITIDASKMTRVMAAFSQFSPVSTPRAVTMRGGSPIKFDLHHQRAWALLMPVIRSNTVPWPFPEVAS
jgi:hypothetical protein